MAILQSCCCWQSLRKGSYASALYTMSYFSLTCFIMGVTVHYDMEYYLKKNTTSAKPKNVSFLEPVEISSVTMIYYLVVLLLSVMGVLCSLLLIIGLYFDVRLFLMPWMIVVGISSFVDISHSVYWLTLDDPSFSPLTAIFFTVELFIFALNIYSLLCIVSQYQEYKAGRGTAEYYNLLHTMRRRDQMPPSSVRCSQQQTTGTSYLMTTASNHPAVRDFCQLSNECSVVQNASTTNDNIKLRRVQFTSDDDKSKPKYSKQHFDIQPLVGDHTFTVDSVTINEDEEEYSGGRNDYLWGSVAEESILICDMESKRNTNDNDEKEKRKKKKKSIIDFKEPITASERAETEGNSYK